MNDDDVITIVSHISEEEPCQKSSHRLSSAYTFD